MLLDAAKIAAEDAERGGPPPAYGVDEVETLWTRVDAIPYGRPHAIGEGCDVVLSDAGHILGSAHVLATLREGGRTVRFGISGDVGLPDRPVVADPTPFAGVEYLQVESTYGDRDHRPPAESLAEFERIVTEAEGGAGNVLVPAFALGRIQDVLYHLNAMKGAGRVPNLRVYVDSPLATRITEVFARHPGALDEDAKGLLRRGDDPFDFPGLRFVRDARESARLSHEARGSLIVASSGMCQSGRIVGHLAAMLPRPETQVVIVGYQAPGTLGDRLVRREPVVRIRGRDVQVRARIHTLGGFSAHAGRRELLAWVGAIREKPRVVFVVHGELHAQMELAKALAKDLGLDARIPRHGESFALA
jgi:metallo-beta-lactamase family protein